MLGQSKSLKPSTKAGQLSAESEPRFIYILSTGRCGTHWLARAFGQVYSDCAVVEHEPLGPEYCSKETLRCDSRLTELATAPPIENHLARIDRILKQQAYIECGWPAFSAVPLFIRRYGTRLRLIHLVRHPATTAASYLSLGFYDQQAKDNEWKRLCQLSPFDPGIKHQSYKHCWEQLEPYEKCLFQWLEIHSYAEEIKRTYSDVPCHTVQMEDLFSEQVGAETFATMADFIGLPQQSTIDVTRSERISSGYRTQQRIHHQSIHRHPDVIALAEYYGYGFDDFSDEKLHKRYLTSFNERLRKKWREPIKRLYKWLW